VRSNSRHVEWRFTCEGTGGGKTAGRPSGWTLRSPVFVRDSKFSMTLPFPYLRDWSYVRTMSNFSIVLEYLYNKYLRILRHCDTSRNFAVSTPDGTIGIFHWPNVSGCNMALLSTQTLT
jgi:hypothetical protein